MSDEPSSPNLSGVRATVVVLGDLGRSPRTCLHAVSLLVEGAAVDLVGHVESELPPALCGLRRSAAIYRQVAARVGLRRCHDASFQKLRGVLRDWFPEGDG